jgi:hypothetical protein
MGIVKVLKRRDASSVIVAIVVAMIATQLLPSLSSNLAGKIAGLHDGQYAAYAFPGAGWKGSYLFPIVNALLQLIILELIIQLYGIFAAASKKK